MTSPSPSLFLLSLCSGVNQFAIWRKTGPGGEPGGRAATQPHQAGEPPAEAAVTTDADLAELQPKPPAAGIAPQGRANAQPELTPHILGRAHASPAANSTNARDESLPPHRNHCEQARNAPPPRRRVPPTPARGRCPGRRAPPRKDDRRSLSPVGTGSAATATRSGGSGQGRSQRGEGTAARLGFPRAARARQRVGRGKLLRNKMNVEKCAFGFLE